MLAVSMFSPFHHSIPSRTSPRINHQHPSPLYIQLDHINLPHPYSNLLLITMGLIKTAMMASAGMYAVNKLAKGYENHQGARSNQQQQQPQQQQQQQMLPQRQSRDYSPNSSARGAGGDYYAPQRYNEQPRSIDQSSAPQEYWYLSNNNEWARVPAEYANMRSGNPNYEPAQYCAPPRQQQLEFEYPQHRGYVVEEVMEPRSRSMVGPEQIQQGLGFLMDAAGKKGGKKGKDDKMSEMMSMFSR